MISYGFGFNIEGIDDLVEQTKQLRDMYDSLKRDFEQDADDSAPHFRVCLDAAIRKTEEGPQIHIDVLHRAIVVSALRNRKEKIEKLLDGIDELTKAAAKFEMEMNHPNNSADLR